MSHSIPSVLVGFVFAAQVVAADPPKPAWKDFTKEPVRIGEVSVKLERASSGVVDGFRNGSGWIFDSHLFIGLTITNHSETRKRDYRPWSLASHTDSRAVRIEDDLGNSYKSFFRPGQWSDSLRFRDNDQSLYPNKATRDTLIYELPVDKAKFIRLTLPAAAVGETGSFYVEFPVSKIGK